VESDGSAGAHSGMDEKFIEIGSSDRRTCTKSFSAKSRNREINHRLIFVECQNQNIP